MSKWVLSALCFPEGLEWTLRRFPQLALVAGWGGSTSVQAGKQAATRLSASGQRMCKLGRCACVCGGVLSPPHPPSSSPAVYADPCASNGTCLLPAQTHVCVPPRHVPRTCVSVRAASCSHAGLMCNTPAPGLSLTMTPRWGLKDADTGPLWPPASPHRLSGQGHSGTLWM